MTRSAEPNITVIYWRDIPAQVVASSDGGSHKVELHSRFQTAIDRAAMEAGRFGADEYLEDWRRQTQPLTGDPEEAATTAAAELENRYPLDALNKLVANEGYAQ